MSSRHPLRLWLVPLGYSTVFLGSLLSLWSIRTAKSSAPARLTAENLAIVINQNDPLSRQIGEYYQKQRRIPSENVILVRFPPQITTLTPTEFNQLRTIVQSKTPANVQAYALTWATPYRVGCMSITAAFAFGYDNRFCAKGCAPTKLNPYFNQATIRPYDELKLRPTMAIAATTFEQAKALIDRGVQADATHPAGTGYLLSTSDRARNVRARLYATVLDQLADRFQFQLLQADTLERRRDVMFYFTGATNVPELATNQFRPGAIGDHLTSFGGMLTDSPQMSSLRWLEAGATGSYGTVVEPCNFPQKFPHPGVVVFYYLKGDTLLEAYWKSVAMPGQGIFIGEPLARPFDPVQRRSFWDWLF